MPSLPQVWLNFVADCTRIVWWLGRICCYYLLHALNILSIKTVFRPLCEVHRQIAYYDSRKWVNLKSNLPIADKYLHNQNPSLGHGKKEELCYDCLEKQWVPIMCSHFIWDDQEKTAVSTLEMGSLFLWGRTDGPPGCQGIFYSWLLFFLYPFNIDCDKFASKFQPKCLSPYSFQPKGSRTFWRTTAWTSCQEVAQTCE